jgi:hypothetical protein
MNSSPSTAATPGVARTLVGGRRIVRQRAARRQQPESDVEAAQRKPLDEPLDLRELGALGTQELAPRRHVEEQVAHLDRGARRVRMGSRTGDLAVHRADGVRNRGRRRPRHHPHARHGRDAGQRLAAKPERAHGLEVADAADLAGGVACQREYEFVLGDPRAVVPDAAQAGSPVLDLDLHRTRAGVEAVLEELLDDGRRPFDHLAGGDLVDQLFGKDPDGHRQCVPRVGRRGYTTTHAGATTR